MTYNMIRRAKFIEDVAKRDGLPSMAAYWYTHWGKTLCEYYISQGEEHPRYHSAKEALKWGETQ
jgi:hypothetical protein